MRRAALLGCTHLRLTAASTPEAQDETPSTLQRGSPLPEQDKTRAHEEQGCPAVSDQVLSPPLVRMGHRNITKM